MMYADGLKQSLSPRPVATLLLAACLCGVSQAQQAAAPAAAGKTNLRPRLRPGLSFRLLVTNTQRVTRTIGGRRVEGSQKLSVDYAFEVEEVDADGTIHLKVAYRAIQLAKDTPSGRVEYDSASPPAQPDRLARPLAALVGQEFRLSVTPEGHIVHVRGVDAMIDRVVEQLGVEDRQRRNETAEGLRRQFGDEAVQSAMARLMAFYPDRPVGVGDSWKVATTVSRGLPMRVDTTMSLAERAAGVAVLKVASEIHPNRDAPPVSLGPMDVTYDLAGKQEGQLRIDPSTGLVLAATITQELAGNVEVHAPHGTPLGVSWPISIQGTLTIERPSDE